LTTGVDLAAKVPMHGASFGLGPRLVMQSFETWIHADDIRRALGRPLEPPSPGDLHAMADFSLRNLPIWMELTGRAHPGRTARVVLTGAGGGSWLVPMGDGTAAETAEAAVDVELEVDVVAWCHRVGERVTTDGIEARVEGDAALARDLLEAASAVATL
jgi:hypothetical protein